MASLLIDCAATWVVGLGVSAPSTDVFADLEDFGAFVTFALVDFVDVCAPPELDTEDVGAVESVEVVDPDADVPVELDVTPAPAVVEEVELCVVSALPVDAAEPVPAVPESVELVLPLSGAA